MPVMALSAQTKHTVLQQATTPGTSCANMSLGLNGALNGFIPSPNDDWHQDI
jgi:hypothetical protein